jgi:hypothetical protein
MKKTATAILSLFLVLVMISDASAYSPLGMKRARITSIGYSTDSSMDSTSKSSLKNAISMWENTPTNTSIKFSENSTYTANFTSQYFGTTGWSGQTQNNGSNGIISLSYIRLNKSYTDSYQSYERDGVWAHEIGHALGLDDITNVYALMHYRDTDRKAWSPSQDEINGINYLY